MILTPQEITLFLLALAVLLAVARFLGELARLVGQPSVLGEILAGVLLGPTLLGRLAPEAQAALFPSSGTVALALEAFFALAISLFLLVAGLEVDLSSAVRQGKTALSITFFGMAVPFGLGFLFAWFLPGLLTREIETGDIVFTLFFSTALAISALPVIAKILKDLNLMQTHLGVLVVASATINDLIGWMIFAVVLGMMGVGKATFSLGMIIFLTLVFVLVALTLGRWLIHRILPFLQAHTSWPGGVLGFALVGALLCAALTEWIGIHAIFGAFIFGVALGDSRYLRERTRHTLDEFISFIFAPLFFASIGLKVDFIAGFDLVAVVIVLVIATVGKVLGCVLGGWLSGLSKREYWALGFAKNARGAMEIILGLLALQYGLIDDSLFVALVIMALVTSMFSGTLMQRILRRRRPVHFADFLSSKHFVRPLRAEERQHAIAELAETLSKSSGVPAEKIIQEVWNRELSMPTGLPNRVAIPHARIDGLSKPLIAVGLSPEGVDFDAPDGLRARVIFLILTPPDQPESQLEILSGIAKIARDERAVEDMMKAESPTEMLALTKSAH